MLSLYFSCRFNRIFLSKHCGVCIIQVLLLFVVLSTIPLSSVIFIVSLDFTPTVTPLKLIISSIVLFIYSCLINGLAPSWIITISESVLFIALFTDSFLEAPPNTISIFLSIFSCFTMLFTSSFSSCFKTIIILSI